MGGGNCCGEPLLSSGGQGSPPFFIHLCYPLEKEMSKRERGSLHNQLPSVLRYEREGESEQCREALAVAGAATGRSE